MKVHALAMMAIAFIITSLPTPALGEYHPTLSRFMQRDPLGYVDGGNLYAGYFVMWGGVDPEGTTTLPATLPLQSLTTTITNTTPKTSSAGTAAGAATPVLLGAISASWGNQLVRDAALREFQALAREGVLTREQAQVGLDSVPDVVSGDARSTIQKLRQLERHVQSTLCHAIQQTNPELAAELERIAKLNKTKGATCPDDRKKALEARKKRWCKEEFTAHAQLGPIRTGGCEKTMGCTELWYRAKLAERCRAARVDMDNECWRGGDLGHRRQVHSVGRAIGKCWLFYNIKHCPR